VRKRELSFERIDKALCERLLREYMPIVGALARLYPYIEKDELLSAGRIAILEGYLRRDKRSSERTWIRRVIHWKLKELASQPEHYIYTESLGEDPQLLNGADPEEQFWRATALHAIAGLTIRRQVIVAAKMQGETYQEVAETLGISTQRAALEGKWAFEELRRILDEEPASEVSEDHDDATP
jgi:RNA polymerase sigma factor (sigma-70 family)